LSFRWTSTHSEVLKGRSVSLNSTVRECCNPVSSEFGTCCRDGAGKIQCRFGSGASGGETTWWEIPKVGASPA
jgi:hypothetical protein